MYFSWRLNIYNMCIFIYMKNIWQSFSVDFGFLIQKESEMNNHKLLNHDLKK